MTLLEFKASTRQVFKVVAGGPSNVTRSKNVIDLLDELAEQVYDGGAGDPLASLTTTADAYPNRALVATMESGATVRMPLVELGGMETVEFVDFTFLPDGSIEEYTFTKDVTYRDTLAFKAFVCLESHTVTTPIYPEEGPYFRESDWATKEATANLRSSLNGVAFTANNALQIANNNSLRLSTLELSFSCRDLYGNKYRANNDFASAVQASGQAARAEMFDSLGLSKPTAFQDFFLLSGKGNALGLQGHAHTIDYRSVFSDVTLKGEGSLASLATAYSDVTPVLRQVKFRDGAVIKAPAGTYIILENPIFGEGDWQWTSGPGTVIIRGSYVPFGCVPDPATELVFEGAASGLPGPGSITEQMLDAKLQAKVNAGGGGGTVVRDGTAIKLDAQAIYNEIFSGSFTVEPTGLVPGATAQVRLATTAQEPAAFGALFEKIAPPVYTSGKAHIYWFSVDAGGRIQYFITPIG